MKFLTINRSVLLYLFFFHLFFFIIKVYIGDFFLEDSYEYFNLAKNIKNDFTFYCGDLDDLIVVENFTKRPPFYGLFILFFSCFLKSKILVLVFQNIISILSILLTINIFSKYFETKNYKLFLLLLLSSVSQFIYANYLMSEILLQFLIILLCYAFYNTLIKKSFYWLFYFQCIIVLLFLTKPVFYLFVIPNIIICFWLSKRLPKASLYSIIPIIVLIMYMSWNKQRTGSFEFSSIQNLALKNYNLFYYNTNKFDIEYASKINEEINKKIENLDSYNEKQKVLKSYSIEYIKKNLFSYSWFHLKGSLRMFIDPGRFDIYNFFNFSKNSEVGFLAHINNGGIMGAFKYFIKQPLIIIIVLPIILIFNIIKFLGFIAFWIKNHKKTPSVLWLAFFIIIYVTLLTGPLSASRFLVPFLPLYCMFAAIGILNYKNNFIKLKLN
jgi:hypothetical protein